MSSVTTANTKEDIDISTMSKNVSILVAIISLTEGSIFTWKGKVVHKPGDRYIGCFHFVFGVLQLLPQQRCKYRHPLNVLM